MSVCLSVCFPSRKSETRGCGKERKVGKENTYWEVADDEAIRTSANFPQKLPCICDLQSLNPRNWRERDTKRETQTTRGRASERATVRERLTVYCWARTPGRQLCLRGWKSRSMTEDASAPMKAKSRVLNIKFLSKWIQIKLVGLPQYLV